MLRFFLILGVAPLAVSSAERQPFIFVAFGCMPYGLPASASAFERVIEEIERHQPVFTVHCGDIKSGSEPMLDDYFETIDRYFMRFTGPLIYTPGDNEWTDVYRENAGGLDPQRTLQRLRETFFAEEKSRGQRPLPLITQRRDPAFAEFVENARWTVDGVVFATLHVVGSNNNNLPEVPGAQDEFQRRDEANVRWLQQTFAAARAREAPAVALFFQANPFADDYGRAGRDSGFDRFLDELQREAEAFDRPVLLVHADEHRYRYQSAQAFERGGAPVAKVARVGLFGASDVHAVLVLVDTSHPDVFLPLPLLAPGNPLPLEWRTAR
jgi:hypothetical protein